MKTHNSTRVATKHSSNSLDASRFMIPYLGQFQHLRVREQSHPQNKEGKCNVALYLRGTWCISLEKKESQKTRSEGNKKKLQWREQKETSLSKGVDIYICWRSLFEIQASCHQVYIQFHRFSDHLYIPIFGSKHDAMQFLTEMMQCN